MTSCNLLTYILLCLNQGCETNNFHPKNFFLGENVGSKVKGQNLKTAVSRRQSTPNFWKKRTFLGVRNVRFSENLTCFVFLKPPLAFRYVDKKDFLSLEKFLSEQSSFIHLCAIPMWKNNFKKVFKKILVSSEAIKCSSPNFASTITRIEFKRINFTNLYYLWIHQKTYRFLMISRQTEVNPLNGKSEIWQKSFGSIMTF